VENDPDDPLFESARRALCVRPQWRQISMVQVHAPSAMLRQADVAGCAPEYWRKRGIRPLACFCLVHGASAVIHAADGMANSQVFCRENSGNGCPVSVCLCSLLVRGSCGHAWRATHGTISLRSTTAGSSSHTVGI
jgi:hypothetical protein